MMMLTEFESIDIAIHMLFLAGEHSYEISRDIASAAKEKGYEGIIYPSYFSLLRTGSMPFDTIYGISIRKVPVNCRIRKITNYSKHSFIWKTNSRKNCYGWVYK